MYFTIMWMILWILWNRLLHPCAWKPWNSRLVFRFIVSVYHTTFTFMILCLVAHEHAVVHIYTPANSISCYLHNVQNTVPLFPVIPSKKVALPSWRLKFSPNMGILRCLYWLQMRSLSKSVSVPWFDICTYLPEETKWHCHQIHIFVFVISHIAHKICECKNMHAEH